jgi:hypothetical protein
MSERKYDSDAEALAVAKEALWLAWQAAGGPSGMGFLQDNPAADKEAVWDRAYNKGDYFGRHGMDDCAVNADYVFGRMLKLRFEIHGAVLEIPDDIPRRDYQGWCGKYKTYQALFEAAEQENP